MGLKDYSTRTASSLKYTGKKIASYFPHERIIDEDAIRAKLNLPSEQEVLASLEAEKKQSEQDNSLPIVHEIRDEANRSWWRFFDEFEYKTAAPNKVEKKWYHWFDPKDTPAERKLILKLDILLAFFHLSCTGSSILTRLT